MGDLVTVPLKIVLPLMVLKKLILPLMVCRDYLMFFLFIFDE